MFKKIFGKSFLLSGIFLLSTFILVQLSWGCDDHDKWRCDDHGKHCHPPLVIQSVDVVFEQDGQGWIFIHGDNFDNGTYPPVVTLGGIKVNVETYSRNEIVATLPPNLPDSDYRLVVSTCHDSACKDKYCKDHGPNCKCKYCKDHCSKCKDKYCKDYECKCRCKDQYSLTIAGPPGPPGLPGILGWQIVAQPAPRKELPYIEKIASCPNGYNVTGGGFQQQNLDITVNGPLNESGEVIYNGWRVFGNIINDDKPATLTVYAICACVDPKVCTPPTTAQ